MANDKAGFVDHAACAVARPPEQQGVGIGGLVEAACWAPGPDGVPVQVWHVPPTHNVVVQQGWAHAGNVLIAQTRGTTDGPFLYLHKATVNTSHQWSNLSNSHAVGYSANLLRLTFASNTTNGSWTATTNMSFSAAETVNGAGILFYTNTSCATNPAAGDVRVFNGAAFSATQAIASNNTLSVSISLTATSA